MTLVDTAISSQLSGLRDNIMNNRKDGSGDGTDVKGTAVGDSLVSDTLADAGESLERPLSAPPPPGFVHGSASSRILPHNLWGDNANNSIEKPSDSDSFRNLEAMLGTGLALSMEDAATDDAALGPQVEGLFEGDLSHQRQSRHVASRLVKPASNGSVSGHLFDSRLYARTGIQSSLGPGGRGGGKGEGFGGFPSLLTNPRPDQPLDLPGSEPHNESQGHRGLPNTQEMRETNPNVGVSASGMWTGAREFTPAAMQHPAESYNGDALSATSSISDSGPVISSAQAESELRPFLWDIGRNRPGRTLAILRVSWLRVPDVRSSCESFGVLESFRADFFSKGICFVSYYDIRSAEYAAVELQSILQRMLVAQGSNEEVMVRYCLPLNASSQFDESQIMFHDLPADHTSHTLSEFLTSYGATRSVISQGGGSFVVEFQSMQDAKQALLELESSQPFGPNITVEVGLRHPTERKRGRELLNIVSRWRQGMRPSQNGGASLRSGRGGHVTPPTEDWGCGMSAASHRSHNSGRSAASATRSTGGHSVGSYSHVSGDAQVIVGPDGRLMHVVVQNPGGYRHQQVAHHPGGHGYSGNNGAMYMQQKGQAFPATVVSNSQYMDHHRHTGGSVGSHYSGHYNSDANSLGGMSGRSHRSGLSGTDDRDNRHLTLDLNAVEAGDDVRTSLMVRNIPNKYTQQMLLSEFMENGLGPGVIDFFYLPIDFKNRCNRGYAFINFVDFNDILPFHKCYFGKHWRTFNSDKICDITYARIQGKAAMLKRFENSALMEKDDEYKPLVFISDGPDKGKRLAFPDPSTAYHR